MTYFDPGNGNMVLVDGMMVEKDALMIAEKIRDYDPNLILITADPDDPRISFTSAPFIVLRDKGNGVFERVLEAWELDDRILERLWAADGYKNDPLAKLVAMEQAKKKEQDDKWNEIKGANNELGAAIIQNPKSKYSFENKEGDMVTIHETKPPTKNKEKKSFS